MAKREKFGKFVLLEELESTSLGSDYRAAKLAQAGLEKVVSVLRVQPALSANAEAVKSLMDNVKFAAQLQNPNVVKIYGIGKVDASYYVSYEFIEGKSLKQVFQRCRNDGFPFSVDHALLIASKICSALEYAHGRKNEAGSRYFHGLVNPGNVLVSYEGEVRVRGFGYWPSRLREAGVLGEEDSLYLAPEQAAGGVGDTRSDLFAVGAILFEILTGEPLFQGGRTSDIPGRLARARLQSPTGDDDSLPRPIADILNRSLAHDPGGRYVEMQEMRKAIDTLLFSGDFTPTTFNLAFFMHSLFRDDIDRESKALKEEKEASYFEFLQDEKPVPAAPPSPSSKPSIATPVPVPVAAPPPAPPAPVHREPVHSAPAPQRETDLFAPKEEPKSKAPIFIGAAAVLLLAAVGAFFMFGKSTPPPPPPTTQAVETPEQIALKKQLEEAKAKLEQFENEKREAEEKAKKEAEEKLRKQAGGGQVDPEKLAKAQEEAAKKAREEQEKKQKEEAEKLRKEQEAAQAKLAEEKKRQDEEAARKAAETASTQPPATQAPVTQPAAPALKPGTLVNLSDPGVIPPIQDKAPPLQYPPLAMRLKLQGDVELNVLVDEKGNVTDAQVVKGADNKAGFNEAATENVKKRRYRPATKDGIPVKVWIPVKVSFRLQ